MSEQDTTATLTPASEPTTETPQAPAAATPKPTEPPKPSEPHKDAPANPWEDADAAKAEIEKLRRENASSRTNAKAQAAEDARKELLETISKALGQDEAPADPAVLTEQLTKAQGEQRQAALELAIYRSTPDAAVANQLLDSRSFLAKVADLDPTDGVAIAAAVGEAVQSIPALGKRAPAPNRAQGSSASGAPSLDQQIADAEKSGDISAALRLKLRQARDSNG